MASESVLINSGTQTPIGVDSIGGTLNIQTFKLNLGGDGVDGAFWDGKMQGGTISNGSIVVTAGTIASDTIVGGTINAATAVITSGTISNNMLSGTLNLATAVVSGGTINASTAQISGGTLSILTDGTLSMLKGGTINTGTINSGTINAGTFTMTVGTLNAGTINTGTMVVNAGANSNAGTYIAARLTDGTSFYNASGGGATVGTINVSTVNSSTLNTGTINSSTINTGTINSATVNAGTFTMTVGTLNSGTINAGTVTVTGGTINASTAQISGGTLGLLSAGTLSMLQGGTINTGTITAGTINTLITKGALGTIGIVSSTGTLNTSILGYGLVDISVSGTYAGVNLTFEATDDGSNYYPVQVARSDSYTSELTSGVIANTNRHWTAPIGGFGTIRVRSTAYTSGTATIQITPTSSTFDPTPIVGGTVTVAAVNGGTLNAGTVQLSGGTINSATINAGTIRDDGRPARNILSFGTTFTVTSGSAWGTLVGSASVGAGTSIWVHDVSVNNPAGTASIIVGFGTQLTAGTNIVLKGTYGTQAAVGHQKTFSKAVNCGMTNQDLTIYVGVPGTVDVNVTYFISA